MIVARLSPIAGSKAWPNLPMNRLKNILLRPYLKKSFDHCLTIRALVILLEAIVTQSFLSPATTARQST